jgi:16S rRNA C967 or C1407 C5-methylase (RsmB/RsmF family)/NOL1/NOP2/fmu family ribosome biogenesis protein
VELPEKLLQSLAHVKGFDRGNFLRVHESGQLLTSIRLNPSKLLIENFQRFVEYPTRHFPLPFPEKIPWSSCGYYLAERPAFTFDPLFHAGCYYVQEASGMFLEQALKQTIDLSTPLRILDLCAAPGGKSTLIQSLVSKESLLVSNEVIKSRTTILEENMSKWGAANGVVTNNDPANFARLENYFDVIVIDAPCSGSGLFRKDATAIQEWSENNVAHCSHRQQRIIADVWASLKKEGILIYSTCSYSEAEDEAILEWLGNEFLVEGIRLKTGNDWGIVEVATGRRQLHGYRFYPDKVKGEGFFIAAVRKKEGGEFAGWKPGKKILEKLSRTDEILVQTWLSPDADLVLFKQHDDIIALPSALQKEIPVLQSALYIKKAGVAVGKLAGKDLIPDHQLALSGIINKNIVTISLNRQQSIQYLRKEEVQTGSSHIGWALVNYEGYRLGWIKALGNRVNNYYPKAWRILKSQS